MVRRFQSLRSGSRQRAPDKLKVILEKKAGDILWREPVLHAEENVGATDFVVLVLEFKTFNKGRER